MAVVEESSSLWLEAHDDALAGLRSSPACMVLADVHGDGDHKLVVGIPGGPGGPRLAVVRGPGLQEGLALPDPPAALGALAAPGGGGGAAAAGGGGGGPGGAAPALLVAAGGALLVYRHLRPFFRAPLPPPGPPDPLEAELWAQAQQDQVDPLTLREMLEDIRDKAQVPLTPRSQWLLTLPPPEVPPFVALHKGRPLQRQTVVTCMGALPRGGPDGTPECPVLGTESGDVLVLDPDAFTVIFKGWVPSPPVFVVPRGGGDGRFRLAVACRDGTLYGLHRSRDSARGRPLAALGWSPVGLLGQEGGLLAAGGALLLALSLQGRRLWSLRPPAPIAAVAGAAPRGRALGGALLALEGGEVRLYRGRALLCRLRAQDTVTGLCFGRYGREDDALIMTTRGGALSIRLLRRKAELGGTHGCPPPGPGPSLPLPPRSRAFVDRALREREGARAMHERFQRDLGGLRLGAARGLAQALGGGQGPGGAPPGLTITASVQGLGPRLRLHLRVLLPGGGPAAPDLLLLLRCHPAPPRLQPPCIKLPLLVPGLSYVVGAWLELDKATPPGQLQVLVLRQGWERPLQSLQVGLPPGGDLAPA